MKTIHGRRIALLLGVFVTASAVLTATAQGQQSIKPVEFPRNLNIPGFHFPEPPNHISRWLINQTFSADSAAQNAKIQAQANANIATHMWGIWTGLTSETDEIYNDQKLLVFETWMTPADIINQQNKKDAAAPRNLRPLSVPHQFGHGARRSESLRIKTESEETVLGFVKYDPSAAKHIGENDLFNTSVLDTFLDVGETGVPAFPSTSIVLKPVFVVMTPSALIDGRYFKLPVWPGPPGKVIPGPAVPWGSAAWNNVVWVDTQNKTKGGGTTTATGDATRTDAATYNVSDFINYQMDAADAKSYNAQNAGTDAVAGNYAILNAMHVTSREITRWTWQTFWWSASPDTPHFPSSETIASQRPAALKGAPRHYAGAPAYSMLVPAQPVVGGQNVGDSVYAYNPHLEAGFNYQVLPDSVPGTYQGRMVANTVGIHTNCMSCHGRANYNPHNLNWAPNYSGVRYVDLADPQFKGTLQVDFLWSIPNNAVTTKKKGD